jgi:hypothetical protein
MIRGTDRAYEIGIKHGVRIAWGADTLYNPGAAARQGAQLTKLTRWYKPADILTMATSTNANLLAESGPRNPIKPRSASSPPEPSLTLSSSMATHCRTSTY